MTKLLAASLLCDAEIINLNIDRANCINLTIVARNSKPGNQ